MSFSAAACKRVNLQFRVHARTQDDLTFPTVSGRSLDVTATGGAGIDWANVENPTTALNLSGTNIKTDQIVGSVTGAVGSVTGNVGGNVVGSVASVTAGVTVTTNNDKTGYALSAAGVQAIWDALTAALTTVGSIGKRLADNIDATISSRSTYAGGDTSGTTTLLSRLTAGRATNLDNLDATISSRSTVTTAQVNTEVVDALNVDTYAEPAAVPAATATIVTKLGWLFALARNKVTMTATTQTLRNDADNADVATSAQSDDGVTYTRAEWL
jgi:hypothetical protein